MDLNDPTAETPISKRLQAEHKWDPMETGRAIKEYKRFLYLTQRAGFEVTPSRPVDLVWHEHLVHTKHYWETLCREVLRNDLHHNPGKGGAVDDARFREQYLRTLEAYQAAFQNSPPKDIWPRPASEAPARFGWVRSLMAFTMFAGAGAALATRTWPLLLVCAVGFVITLATAGAKRNQGNTGSGGCGAGCGSGAIGSTGCADSGDGSTGGDGGGDGGGCGGGGD